MAAVDVRTEVDVAGGHVKWCAIMYAFVPSVIEVAADEADAKVVVSYPTGHRDDTTGDYDEWWTEERTCRNGKAWFDASAFVRAYFRDVEKMPLPSMSIAENPLYDADWAFKVQIGGDAEYGIQDVTAAWGAYGFWDSLTAERHLIWNPNMPMTIDVFATRLDAIGDYDGQQSAVALGSGGGWLPAWRVPMSQLAVGGYPDLLMEMTAGDAYEYKNGRAEDGRRQDILLVMDFRKPDEGYYLRWLDRFGRMCYRMFSKGKRSLTVSHENGYVRTPDDLFLANPAIVDGHSGGNMIYADVSAAETLTMGDEFVDNFEISEVMGLMQSMYVEMLVDGAWYRVNVVPSSFTYDLNDEKHRFGLAVHLPSLVAGD